MPNDFEICPKGSMALALEQQRQIEALTARVAAAQRIADEDRVDHPIYGTEGPFDHPGWKSKMGRDLHQALNGEE